MASIETRANGSTRVLWRWQGAQQRLTVDNPRTAKMLVKWLDRNGVRAADDPDLMFAIGRTPAAAPMADVVTVKTALDGLLTPSQSDATQKDYRLVAARLAPLHDVPISGLARVDIESIFDALPEKYADATVKHTAIVTKMALRPYGKGELVGDYARGVPDRQREPVVMSRATMDLMAALGRDEGIGDLLTIVGGLGVRFGEAVALRRDHCIGLDGTPMATIREQYPSVCVAASVKRTPTRLKTKRSRRDIPLSAAVHELALSVEPGAFLSPDSMNGGPWRHWYAARQLVKVNRVAMAEGVIDRPVKFHDFRHSWGAHLLNGGMDIVTVSRLLGHSSVTITGDTYGHLTAGGIDRVRDLLK